MAELVDKRREQFAKLLAVGMRQGEAYGRAGYRAADRSNASKLAREPDIIQRVSELKAEEAERQAKLRMQAGERDGLTELKAATAGAVAAGNWSAAIQGAHKLAEADGSLDALGLEASRKPLSVKQMLGLAKDIGPGMWLAVAEALLLWDGENNRPMPPWTNAKNEPIPPFLQAKDGRLVLVTGDE